MIAHQLPTKPRREKLQLRFTREIWNAYTPTTQATTRVPPKSKTSQHRKRTPTAIETEDGSVAKLKLPKRSPAQPKPCKVKITRFQYGGAHARVAGKYRNATTLETPCLQRACESCWDWHARLMRRLFVLEGGSGNECGMEATEAEAVGLVEDVDVRLGGKCVLVLRFGTVGGRRRYRELVGKQAWERWN